MLTNVIDLNGSGITIDMTTGKIGFPVFGLFKFFSNELKDSHNVTFDNGEIIVTKKITLYGEGGKVFAKDLPFFRKAINSIPYLRNIGSVEGFCNSLLKEIPKRYVRGLSKQDIEDAKKIAAGDYIIAG